MSPSEERPGWDDATRPISESDARAQPSVQRIGPYRILGRIGEGGFGEIYAAEQSEPVKRRVALKVLKAGMDTKAVLARFEAERQALAMMDHPNIARVFDAGVTEGGRPYFAMEYVPGVPITEHCDRHRLSTRERLELFMEVCYGVQHAHQKAVIHRDLKPTNVLVATQDGKHVPKIIDFGVAKAMAQPLTERTLFTEMGQLIGTPAYMSPEQAEMTAQDIDTRSDVYSLGAMLYELLIGTQPFDPKDLRKAGLDGIRRMIREVDPPRPSTRISSLGDEATTSATKRRSTPRTLVSQLRGDLDWITMKALEKERTRRYGAPSELAADIGRHLRHEPVTARPPSTVYRMQKFVRRHSIGVAFGATGALLLVGFAARERIQAERIAAERDRASQEAEAARQVSEFLIDLFEVSDPSEAKGNTITARQILDRGAAKIRETLRTQPQLRARLMGTMGSVYGKLALYEPAASLFEEALETRRSVLGEEHTETLDAMFDLADLYHGQGRFAEAESLFVPALEARRRVLGEEHPSTLTTMNALAALYSSQGRYHESESLNRRALEICQRALGEEHPETLASMRHLGALCRRLGRYEEAEALHRKTLETNRRVLGEKHVRTLAAMGNLGNLYLSQRRFDDAEPLLVECLRIAREILGEDHVESLQIMNSVAGLYWYQDRFDESEALLLEILERRRRTLGEDHPETLASAGNLALVYQNLGRYDEAESLQLEALERRRRILGDQHPDLIESLYNLGLLYGNTRRYEKAESYCRESLEISRRALGEDHPTTNLIRCSLAGLFAKRGVPVEAVRWLREAMAHGHSDLAIAEDPDLVPLRGDPEFEEIVAELQRRNEESTASAEAAESE